MTWQTPFNATDGTALTAAQLNQIRDNLLETAPAKATADVWPRHFVSTGANAIAERRIIDDNVDGTNTSTNETYTDLSPGGPNISLTTGTHALVFISGRLSNNTAGGVTRMSFEIQNDGGNDGRAVLNQGSDDLRATSAQLISAVDQYASNTFAVVYRVDDHATTGSYTTRRMCVMGL